MFRKVEGWVFNFLMVNGGGFANTLFCNFKHHVQVNLQWVLDVEDDSVCCTCTTRIIFPVSSFWCLVPESEPDILILPQLHFSEIPAGIWNNNQYLFSGIFRKSDLFLFLILPPYWSGHNNLLCFCKWCFI